MATKKQETKETKETREIPQEDMQDYIAELEAKAERLELLEAELEAKPGAQSRGIAWTDLWGQKTDENGDVKAVKINITQRSDVDSEDALRQLISTISGYAKEIKMTPYVQSAKIPTRNGAKASAPPQQPTTTAPASSPPGSSPIGNPPPEHHPPASGNGNGEMLHLNVIKIVVEPKSDGKATIQFFAKDRKYADLYISNRPIEKIMEVFPSTWIGGYFDKPGNYPVEMVADYKISKRLNDRGNLYKDVYAVRNA